jgi:hypothetical protein
LLYNAEFVRGEESEEEFATLHTYKPDKKEIESLD